MTDTPAAKAEAAVLIAVALPRPGSGLDEVRVAPAGTDSWPKLGVVAPPLVRAVTVVANGVPAMKGGEGTAT